jgi:hypothetical protein
MAIKRVLRAKVVVGAALALLFGSGVVVGLAWDRTASASTPEPPRAEEPDREDRNDGRIVDRVGLSAAQKTSVDSLVAYHRGRMRNLDAEFRPRYRTVISDLREEIKEVLTDDQRSMYQALLEEHDAKRHSRRSRNSKQ